MTGSGVFAGAARPSQVMPSKPGTPDSATVGMSGASVERWLVVMARPFNCPARIIGSDQMMLSKMYCTRPSITSGADCTPVR